MITASLFAMALAQGAPSTLPKPLTDIHKRDLSCVAALAIVASEQERGVASSFAYPLLENRGRTYAGLVGERVMQETNLTREQVRDQILTAVTEQQRKVADVAGPKQVVEAEMEKCLPLLDKEVPSKPKPTLGQCAAILELAYREVHQREGLSKKAQDLKTLAFVLDNRAREDLKANGYSGNESDIILTQLREEMLADEKAKKERGESADLDFDHCFKLAAPKQVIKDH